MNNEYAHDINTWRLGISGAAG